MSRKIYLASSWRNAEQPWLVETLRLAGHEVYDFRNPAPGNTGFKWSAIDPGWTKWTPSQFIQMVDHEIAHGGYGLDKAGMDWADTCVMALPCGKSAHLEAGYMAGQGKRVIFFLREERFEPELMYLLALNQPHLKVADILTDNTAGLLYLLGTPMKTLTWPPRAAEIRTLPATLADFGGIRTLPASPAEYGGATLLCSAASPSGSAGSPIGTAGTPVEGC